MYNYRARAVRCVDGDTVDLEVDLGFKIFTHIRARLIGVDTPERGQEDYKRATMMLTNLLTAYADDNGLLNIKTEKTGKYGRWVVEIEGVNSVLAEKWPYES